MNPTVDDNTGTIECHHKDLVTPLSPSKRKDRTFRGFDYPSLPPPVTYVGRPVTIFGRVCRGRKVYLTVESIGGYFPTSPPSEILRLRSPASCKSYNEELTHLNTALVLRESHYFINTPFVIPEATEQPEEQTQARPVKQTPPRSLPPPTCHVSERRTPDCKEQIPSKFQPVRLL